jgi:hypothetical protein
VVDPIRVRLDFDPASSATKEAHGNSDTRLGRWLQAVRTPLSTDVSSSGRLQRDQDVTKDASPPPASKESGSVRRASPAEAPPLRVDSIYAEVVARASDMMAPSLPRPDAVVTTSLSRREFIRQFALQRGVTGAALDTIWRSNKRDYNASHDAHFDRFQIFFRRTKPDCDFAPLSILPGDLVAFLQTMDSDGYSFASIKDASASISMACREATDGDIALGDRESVKRFLKSLRIHAPIGMRKQLAPSDHDVAALYQEAWDFGPNEALYEGHLKEKLLILLMVDTAARPSGIHRLFRTTKGCNAQIRFEGQDLFV